MKYRMLTNGEGMAIKPGEILLFACCDCGLVHDVAFVYEDGEIGVAMRRNPRATGQRRRWMRTEKLLRMTREELVDDSRT